MERKSQEETREGQPYRVAAHAGGSGRVPANGARHVRGKTHDNDRLAARGCRGLMFSFIAWVSLILAFVSAYAWLFSFDWERQPALEGDPLFLFGLTAVFTLAAAVLAAGGFFLSVSHLRGIRETAKPVGKKQAIAGLLLSLPALTIACLALMIIITIINEYTA